jgi:group I intron endonuclease
MVAGIYIILNNLNGKVYVGRTHDLNHRLTGHKRDLRIGGDSPHLQKSWKKYGAENFTFKVIEEIKNATTELLIAREGFWMNHYNSRNPDFGYNKYGPEAGTPLGYKRSDETKAKMSKRMKGHKFPKETLTKLSEASKKMWEDPERRAKFCASRKEMWKNPEHKEKVASKLRGKKRSEETCRRMSESLKGRAAPNLSEESRKKLSDSLKNSEKAKAQRCALAEINRNRVYGPTSEETRKKQSLAKLGKHYKKETPAVMAKRFKEQMQSNPTRLSDTQLAKEKSKKERLDRLKNSDKYKTQLAKLEAYNKQRRTIIKEANATVSNNVNVFFDLDSSLL